MKMKSFFFKSSLVFAATLMLCGNTLQAANGTWYSTNTVVGSAYWTNSYNWSVQPYPAGDQTATFNNSGNGRTVVDVAGLTLGCKDIFFDTANAASYTIGSGGTNGQSLVFTNNSIVRVSSSVNSNQTLNTLSMLGIDRNTSAHNYRNDKSSVNLIVAGNLTVTNTGTAGTKTLITLGAGPITFAGNIGPNGSSGINFTNNTAGLTTLTGSNRFANVISVNGPMTFSGTNHIAMFYQNTDRMLTFTGTNILERIDFNGSALFPAIVTITADSCLALTNGGGQMLGAYQDTVINGPGYIAMLPCTPGNLTGDNLVAPGKTLTINANMVGPNGVELWTNLGSSGTYAFNGANSFANLTVGPLCTVSFNTVGNNGSTTSSLGKGAVTVGVNGTRLLYTGAGETANRILTLNASCIIEQGGSGYLNLSGAPTIGGSAKTITLQGSTAADAEFSGQISNASGANSIDKSGSGKWLFTTNHTYAGSTTVNAGTLTLSGVNGSINASTGYTLAGGTLLLDNTAAANNTNRLRDASAITLNGGTLNFSNSGGAANYAENAGPLTANAGASTIATAQAAVGQTATLRVASLAVVAGTVNFTGTGLGDSDRNRIFIDGQPDGLIGLWATFNGTQYAAYSSPRGVYAAPSTTAFTDIAARGPSTITSNAASNVRINTDGVSGPIELGSDVTRVASLLQNTITPAEINTAGKTLQTASITVPSGRAAVTVGQASADGTLAPLAAGGTLFLNNSASVALTVNAVVADNGSASKLSKTGTGVATLFAPNTFSGDTIVGAGSLVLAHSNALQNSSLTTAGTVFDSSVPSHAFTLGNLSGTFNLSLADNAGSPSAVALTVGKNNANALYGGTLLGNGSLTKIGTGTLTLSGASIYAGGLALQQGTVVASAVNALGVGPVTNNATLNLTAGNVAYSGLSTSLTGSGTNNVTLSTGSNTTDLNGDYSGFTGIWNIGTNAAAGSGRARMRGLDNASATLNILSNGTLWIDTIGTHNAALVLNGGDTGEIYGQLRVDNGAVWAGPVTLAGDITSGNDGLLGSEGGVGTVSGVISDRGGTPHLVKKMGTQTLVLTGDNTYKGQTWVWQGTLRAASIKSVGAASSALGAPENAVAGTLKVGNNSTNAMLVYFGMGDTADRVIDLAGTTGGATLDMSGTNALTLIGGMTATGSGSKTLTLQGSTIGVGEFIGVISNGPSAAISLVKTGSGKWTLANANDYNGGTFVSNGVLVAAHHKALGTNLITIVGNTSTLALDNDGGAEENVCPLSMGAGTVGTIAAGRATSGEAISHRLGPMGLSTITLNITNGANVTSGTPAIVAESLSLSAGSAGATVLVPTTANLLIGSVAILANGANPKSAQLDGTSSDNAITGPISNGLNTVSLTKSNASTWTLYGSNAFSGATAVTGGKLVISGSEGKISGTSGITLSGNSKLELRNHELTNNTDRLRDASGLTLNGGKLLFSHAGGAAHFTETAGALTIGPNSNVVATSQADATYTSVVTFASLARTGSGILDFRGAGLGDPDQRNQVLINAQPAGLIGLWATHNATNFAAYSATLGVIPADDTVFTDIPAMGPYEIADSAALNARIASEGTDGPTALQGLPTSTLKSLLQNWATPSTIGMTGQTLQVSDIMIAAGKEALTLGTQEDEGLVMAAAAGGGLALINESTSTLTLNAAVTNNTSASSLAKYGSGPVKLTGRNSYTGVTLIDKGVLEISANVPQRLSGVISGAGTLTKSGTNQLQILAANTYTGPTYINAGIVRPDQNTTFGPANAGTVTIATGATLDLACDSTVGGTRGAGNLNMQGKPIIVSGHGVDGAGAITCNGGQSQEAAINNVSLTADTTFGGNRRWDFRNFGTLNMNDNTLFKTGVNEIAILSSTLNPGAGHIVVNQYLLRFETTSTINGTAANTVTVNNGAILEMYNLSPCVPQWTAILNAHAQFRGAGTLFTTNYNVWGGPITLNGNAYFNGNQANINFTVTGGISGTGSVVKAGTVPSTLYLMSSNNTYSGGTIITNGTLFARYPGSLPGYDAAGKLTVVSGATLSLRSYDGEAGWNGAQLKTLSDSALFITNTSVLAVDTAPASVEFGGNLSQPMTLTKLGGNVLTLPGVNTFNGPMNVNGGEMVLNGAGNHRIGAVSIGTAALTLTNAAQMCVYVTNNNTSVGNAAADFGRLTVAGNAVWSSTLAGDNTGGAMLYVGNSGRGVLTVQDSATISNRLVVGNNAGSHGAIYQRGGLVHNWCGRSSDAQIGNSGYGYYELSSGTLTNNGHCQLGFNPSGVGIMVQYGGRFSHGSVFQGSLHLSRGGTGVVYLAAGTFSTTNTTAAINGLTNGLDIGYNGNNNTIQGYGSFTVAGSASAVIGGSINMADRTNFFAAVNLNGGTLAANFFTKGARYANTALLNFNGGTFRARKAGNLFASNAFALDAVNVYPGGATIDSAGLAVTANANLRAPSGNGVASITLAPRGGYIGPPMVTIAGGGIGATAIANFDSASGFVTGVTITSPGYDYTSVPTVTLSGGGTNLQTAVTGVMLAPNGSGGLTKTGDGTLTLTGTNTYGGATTLTAGTLKLNNALALPATTTLTFAGGTLDLNGLTLTNMVNTTGALSGGITNGILRTALSPAGEYLIGSQTYGMNIRAGGSLQAYYVADVATDGTCDVLAVQGNIDLSNFALQIVDLDGLNRTKQYTILTCTGTQTGKFASTNLPDNRWKIFYNADGSVKLAFFDGLIIRVK